MRFIGDLRDDQRKCLDAQPSGRAIGIPVKDIHDDNQVWSSDAMLKGRFVLIVLFSTNYLAFSKAEAR